MLSSHHFWPPANFGAVSAELSDLETAKFVVLPVPYDSTTTWRGGTRSGPAAIIEASMNMELFDRELGREIGDAGIHTTDDVEPVMSGPEGMAQRIEEVIGEVLDAGKVPFMLGGEHSLTLGGVRALAARSEKISILQIDAHTDLRDEYADTQFGQALVGSRKRRENRSSRAAFDFARRIAKRARQCRSILGRRHCKRLFELHSTHSG
jgi:agmatinase